MGARSTGSHPTTTKADGHLLEYFRQTFGAGGGGTNEASPIGHSATGGVISDYTSSGIIYRSHTFTSTGTFDVDEVGTLQSDVEVVLIAGGGGGGIDAGGGGGAGAFYPNTSVPISSSPGSYPITIGGGGRGADVPGTAALTGSNTVAFGYTVKGGGGGGSAGETNTPGGSSADPFGGSGGGGRRGSTAGSGGTYGNDGYSGSSPTGGGGGGGAGGAAPSSPKFIGGPGISNSIETGSAIIYAGGGSGGNEGSNTNRNPAAPGGGGDGGGKDSPLSQIGRGGDATAGLGAGGGGGGGNPAPRAGGNGGSGRVIIRYKLGTIQSPGISPKGATGGAISIYNNKVIHTFLNTATFTTPASFSETVEYVVVGGGGGGGAEENSTGSGGGGAGAFRTGTTPIGNSQNFTVQIGAGGKGGNIHGGASPNSALDGIVGTASFFGPPITAPGGGFGAGQINNGGGGASGGGGKQGNPGGSANGGSFPGTIGPSPTSGWGHAGGSGISSPPISGGGGGGGAGAAGVNGTSSKAGFGGAGIQIPTTFRDPASSVGAPGPTSNWITGGDNSGKYWFAGGGGGGASGNSPSAIGKGGAYNGTSEIPGGPWSGAGDGVSGSLNAGDNALTNTGSGGGGAGAVAHGATPGDSEGGQGGSGIVLIAYPS